MLATKIIFLLVFTLPILVANAGEENGNDIRTDGVISATELQDIDDECQPKYALSEEKTEPEDMFIFVGELISIEEIDFYPECSRAVLLDSAWVARYRIVEVIEGSYSEEVIEFLAFDHYGRPEFSDHPHALLFVSQQAGDEIPVHAKYQFRTAWKDRDEPWRTCVWKVPPEEYLEDVRPMQFPPEAAIDITRFSADEREEYYPAPYFRIEGDKAICQRGMYVSDVVELVKRTVLTSRGIYKDN